MRIALRHELNHSIRYYVVLYYIPYYAVLRDIGRRKLMTEKN